MGRWCLYADTELGWNRRILAPLPERKTASDGSDFLCSDAGKCWIKGSEHRDGGGVSTPMLTDAESVKYDTGKFKLYEVLRNFYD